MQTFLYTSGGKKKMAVENAQKAFAHARLFTFEIYIFFFVEPDLILNNHSKFNTTYFKIRTLK